MCHVARGGHKVRTAQKISHSTAGTERSAAAFAAVKQPLCLNSEVQTIFMINGFPVLIEAFDVALYETDIRLRTEIQTATFILMRRKWSDQWQVAQMHKRIFDRFSFSLILDQCQVAGIDDVVMFHTVGLSSFDAEAKPQTLELAWIQFLVKNLSAGGGACRKTRADKARCQNYRAEFASCPSVASHFLNLS